MSPANIRRQRERFDWLQEYTNSFYERIDSRRRLFSSGGSVKQYSTIIDI